MIELRWIWQDMHFENPQPGAVKVDHGLYQILQYRQQIANRWTEWTDVPHSQLQAKPHPSS